MTRIAYDNGFASVAVFNKAFKNAYGETPSVFRKQSRKKKEEAKEQKDTIVEERLEEFLRNDGIHREEQKALQTVRTEFSASTQTETKFSGMI